MAHLTSVAPEFPVLNVKRSIRYYEEKLGFYLGMMMPEEDYAIVERDKVAIHLFRSRKGNAPGSIHIYTEGLDELHAELLKRGAQIKQGIEEKPWGARDFRAMDDAGNEIKFTELIG